MRGFNPMKPVSMWNRAIEAEFYTKDRPNLTQSAFFGSARSFAEWLDAFDYNNGDVFGWTGDSATMEAVESFRKESEFVAIPEFITMFDLSSDLPEIIGPDEFKVIRDAFRNNRAEYRVRVYELPDKSSVHAVMWKGERLISYVWHVPLGANSVIS